MWQLLIGIPVVLVGTAVALGILSLVGYIGYCVIDAEPLFDRANFEDYWDEDLTDKFIFGLLGSIFCTIGTVVLLGLGCLAYAVGDSILFGG